MISSDQNNSNKTIAEENEQPDSNWTHMLINLAASASTAFISGFCLAAGTYAFNKLIVNRSMTTAVNDPSANLIHLAKHA